MKIKVTNCQECPFSNHDNEYGTDSCNLDKSITEEIDLLPKQTIHEKCPLRNESVKVSFAKNIEKRINGNPPKPPRDTEINLCGCRRKKL